MAAPIGRKWGWITARGAVAVLFGIVALMRPDITLGAIVILFGAYAFAEGVYLCVSAIADRRTNPHWLAVLFGGFAGIAIGGLTLLMPGVTALTLLYLIAAWSIARGVVEIVTALRMREVIRGEWAFILAGLLSVAFGVLLLVQPGIGTLVLMAWLGVYAILFGILLIVLSLKLRNFAKAAVV